MKEQMKWKTSGINLRVKFAYDVILDLESLQRILDYSMMTVKDMVCALTLKNEVIDIL